MKAKYILHSKYLRAQKIVEDYQQQILNNGKLSPSALKINQHVKRNYPESWDYWITEIKGLDVLLRTTQSENDPNYDDFWVNICEIRLPEKV